MTTTQWIEEELDTVNFKDARLDARSKTILLDLYNSPQSTLYGSSADEANAKGVYRFQANEKTTSKEIHQAHRQASITRLKSHSVVLGVNDTTELDFTTQSQKEGVGYLHTKNQQGFLLHPMLLLTPEKVPLGTVDVNMWSRKESDFGKKAQRASLPIEEKESYRWIRAYRELADIQSQCPNTQLISVSDAESDIYELFSETQTLENAPHVLLRAHHNRSLENEVQKLWPYMETATPSFPVEMVVPRKGKQSSRTAQVQVSYSAIELKAPATKEGNSIPCYAVYIREINPPDGIEPLSWMLLTTSKVTKAKHALKIIRWYAARWQIEIFFKILKTSCKILSDQTHKNGHFEINLAFKLIVAWRIFYATMTARETPEASCELLFSPEEWKALWCHDYQTAQTPQSPPSIEEIVRMLARLGGYKQSSKNMLPGPLVLAKGFAILPAITSMFCIMTKQQHCPSFAV